MSKQAKYSKACPILTFIGFSIIIYRGDENVKNEEYTVTAENIRFKLLIPQNDGENDDLVNFTMHTHSYTEIFACVSGNLKIVTENEIYHASGGELLVVPSNVRHRLDRAENGSKWCAFGIFYTKAPQSNAQDIYKIIAHISGNGAPHIYTGSELCRDTYQLITNVGKYYLPALELLCILLKTGNAESKPLADSENTVYRLEYMIDSCFMHRINADILASKLNISVRQLSRIVNKRYGVSLHEVITRKRLEAAAQMLEKTDRNAEMICYEVGFSNKNSFFREFQKLYRLTPMQYRKAASTSVCRSKQ